MADEDRTDATEETIKEPTSAIAEGPDNIVDDVVVAMAAPDPAEETKTEEKPEDDSAPELESISDEQYTEAETLGISRSQAEELGTEGLTRVVRKLTPPDSAQTSDAPASRDATEPLVEEPPRKQAGVVLDPDVYDAELVTQYVDENKASVEAEVSRRLAPIQDRLHKLTVKAELREEHENSVRFSGYIESLGESWAKEFGSTNPTRTQQGNRSNVRSDMEVERIGRESLGLPSFSEDKLFQRALSKGHPEKAQQLAREEITSTLTKRSKKMISRPTQSKGPKLTNTQRAIRKVTAVWNKRGLDEPESVGGDDLSVLDT